MQNPVPRHPLASPFTGGDSVIKEYYLFIERWENANADKITKYPPMIDCVQ